MDFWMNLQFFNCLTLGELFEDFDILNRILLRIYFLLLPSFQLIFAWHFGKLCCSFGGTLTWLVDILWRLLIDFWLFFKLLTSDSCLWDLWEHLDQHLGGLLCGFGLTFLEDFDMTFMATSFVDSGETLDRFLTNLWADFRLLLRRLS